jgi:transposase
VIVDHTNRRVLEVLENREQTTVEAYLRRERERGLLSQVEEVTTDMWDAYVNAAQAVFGPAVAAVVDRFHVMKNLQERLTQARRELQRTLPKEAAQELKGSRWLWVTNPEELDDEGRQRLEGLKTRFPALRRLADQRDSLRALFEDRTLACPQTAVSRLQDWIRSARELGLAGLNAFCKTLENWLQPIANYFRSRSTNGPTEGFNHGLRLLLWRSFGMTNFAHFRLRVLDRFGQPQAQ